MIHRCPGCNISLKGRPYPQDIIEARHYNITCDECGGPNHLDLRIAIYDKVSKKVTAWKCPNCYQTWPNNPITLEGSYEYNYI